MVFMKEVLEKLKGKKVDIYTTELAYDYEDKGISSRNYAGVLTDLVCNRQQDVVAVNIVYKYGRNREKKYTIMLSAVTSISIDE